MGKETERDTNCRQEQNRRQVTEVASTEVRRPYEIKQDVKHGHRNRSGEFSTAQIRLKPRGIARNVRRDARDQMAGIPRKKRQRHRSVERGNDSSPARNQQYDAENRGKKQIG